MNFQDWPITRKRHEGLFLIFYKPLLGISVWTILLVSQVSWALPQWCQKWLAVDSNVLKVRAISGSSFKLRIPFQEEWSTVRGDLTVKANEDELSIVLNSSWNESAIRELFLVLNWSLSAELIRERQLGNGSHAVAALNWEAQPKVNRILLRNWQNLQLAQKIEIVNELKSEITILDLPDEIRPSRYNGFQFWKFQAQDRVRIFQNNFATRESVKTAFRKDLHKSLGVSFYTGDHWQPGFPFVKQVSHGEWVLLVDDLAFKGRLGLEQNKNPLLLSIKSPLAVFESLDKKSFFVYSSFLNRMSFLGKEKVFVYHVFNSKAAAEAFAGSHLFLDWTVLAP